MYGHVFFAAATGGAGGAGGGGGAVHGHDDGVEEKDPARAAHWYAAEKGDSEAQFKLGCAYPGTTAARASSRTRGAVPAAGSRRRRQKNRGEKTMIFKLIFDRRGSPPEGSESKEII